MNGVYVLVWEREDISGLKAYHAFRAVKRTGGCGRLSVVYNIRQVGSIVIYIGRGSFTCEGYRRTQMNWIETEFAFWFRHRRVSSVERNRTTQ